MRTRTPDMTIRSESSWDVVIAGAGPAGLSCARVASEGGLSTLVVDRKVMVGEPVQCAEYVPRPITRELPLPSECISRRVSKMITHMPDGTSEESSYPGYILYRDKLETLLAERCREQGVSFALGTRVLGVKDGRLQVKVGRRSLDIPYRYLVGADGPLSRVGASIGVVNQNFVVGAQYRAGPGEDSDATEVFFYPECPGGYAWVFPKAASANIGVGVNPRFGKNARRVLDGFLRGLQEKGRFNHPDIQTTAAGLIPVGGPLERTVVGNVILAGDAAGMTDPITGAGIHTAVVAGTSAGEAMVRSVNREAPNGLDHYEQDWKMVLDDQLRRAAQKRRELDDNWPRDPEELAGMLRTRWIAFEGYYHD